MLAKTKQTTVRLSKIIVPANQIMVYSDNVFHMLYVLYCINLSWQIITVYYYVLSLPDTEVGKKLTQNFHANC